MVAVKVSRWAIFGVLIFLVPLIYSYLNLLIKAKPANMQEIIVDGELLILIGAMCAGAIGELIGSDSSFKIPKIMSAGATVFILIVSVLEFASIAEARFSKIPLDLIFIEKTSTWLFLSALISCGCCVALSEK